MDYKTLRETDENVVILPGARVSGNVTFGPGCSVWYNAVIRGDDNPVIIGENCNVQDGAVFHPGLTPLVVGDNVTVGHGAIVHCAGVGSGTVIGKECLVGAGAVVTGKMNAPDGSLILGNPAKVVRPLTAEEIAHNYENAAHYARKRELYR